MRVRDAAPDSSIARSTKELALRRPIARYEHVASRTRTGFVLLRPDGFVASSGSTPQALAAADALLATLSAAS